MNPKGGSGRCHAWRNKYAIRLYYRRIFEFSEKAFEEFDAFCRALKIPWFSTVQDIDSLNFLLPFDLPMYKIASSNATNQELIQACVQNIPKEKGIVISVAGTSLEEIEETLNAFKDFKSISLLHCVAEYPCPYEDLKLGNIPFLINKFGDSRIHVGYSWHEKGFIPTLAAIDLGSQMVERHFTISRDSFVHHIECSLEPQEFKEMVDIVHTNSNLKPLYEPYLPPISYKVDFSMTEQEKSFLKDQVYSCDYLRSWNG